MRCDGCGQNKDSVAIAKFQWVISVVFLTYRNPVVGAYCTSCRVTRGIGLSLVSAAVGWLGFPFGLIWTPIAIVTNLAAIFKRGMVTTPLAARIARRPAANGKREHVAIEIRGQASLPEGREAWFRHTLVDVTHPKNPLPVLALLDWQQAADSRSFSDVTAIGVTQRGQFLDIRDWYDASLHVFPEATQAPASGHRELLSIVELMSAPNVVLWKFETPFSMQLPLEGYVEGKTREHADDGLIVRMAVAVAAAAGDVSDVELQVIRSWSQARLGYLVPGDPDRASRVKALNGSLVRSVTDADQGNLDLTATITRFLKEGSEGGRLEAIELCLAVMKADGVADRDELALINRLVAGFKIDPKWFADARDKSFSGLATQTSSAADYATLLGIDPKASKDTIRLELNRQYDRWSSRAVSLADPARRREAEAMLETIAQARAELL